MKVGRRERKREENGSVRAMKEKTDESASQSELTQVREIK